ncbi:uncharacterized protein LOC125241801 [Leguminivora glycinivorella]|uniref:uncharacterized protein LOC125241801 n=1 Tax=Leguminivora glycinivorella TaxID=1035111 RepID=UPI00200F5830|nr:uncharacterized protein LOC125241801 [Leguminivora glycinivorella]
MSRSSGRCSSVRLRPDGGSSTDGIPADLRVSKRSPGGERRPHAESPSSRVPKCDEGTACSYTPDSDFQFSCDENGDSNGTPPVITLEVMSDCSTIELCPDGNSSDALSSAPDPDSQDHGLHFLTIKKCQSEDISDNENSEDKDQEANENSKTRNELLEYVTRNDGSVVCKLCGEILQSRTHWYRHKYKRHVIQPLNPAPLFQCEQCLVFFKSRKGYIGHLSSRHSEILTEPSPVISGTVSEVVEKLSLCPVVVKREPEAEPAPQAPAKQAATKTETKKSNKVNKDNRNKEDWEEKRYREEKLVAEIIDRVKRECEAQGGNGGARRGYTRRTTVMHT